MSSSKCGMSLLQDPIRFGCEDGRQLRQKMMEQTLAAPELLNDIACEYDPQL